jgi:DNA-binding transcriptional regulator YhcF (GntR family)
LQGYEEARIGILGGICRELQQAHGQNPFYLSARTGAEMLGVSPMTISRWLFLLEHDRWIRTVEKGGTAKGARKATRFFFLAR